MTTWLALLAFLPLPALPAQDPCSVEGACRRIGTLSIEGPDGRKRDLKVNKTVPWLAEGNVMLAPGDSITITLDATDQGLAPRLVRTGAASAATAPQNGEIRFSLGNYVKGAVMLTVENARSDTLDYAAVMSTVSGAKQTSVCSLLPRVRMMEHWQSPMHLLALSHFRPTSTPGCKTIDPKK